jgi:hypothetical protein
VADTVKKKETQKVNDVSKPSATATSRPIIVTHSPVMRDSTLVNDGPKGDPELEPDKSAPLMATHELTIEPSAEAEQAIKTEQQASVEPEVSTKTDAVPIKVSVQKATPKTEVEESEAKPETEQPKTEESEPAPTNEEPKETTEEPAEKSQVDQDAELQKQELAAQEAKAIHDAQIDQLVDEEKYFLPLNRIEKRRQHFVIIGAIIAIILAVAWLDVVLDAGLVSNTYHLPHTTFFSLKS